MSGFLARRRDDDRGVTLILFALMLTVLLVFVALALDTGLVFNERRQDQSAADAAALAAAQILVEGGTTTDAVEAIITSTYENTKSTNGVALEGPGGWRERWTTCSDTAPPGFTDNSSAVFGGTASDCIAFDSPAPSPSITKAWVSLPLIKVKSTFGRVVGIDEFESTAEAIGEIVSGEPYAIFANSSTCAIPASDPFGGNSIQALDIDRRTTVTGPAHSNLDVEVEDDTTTAPSLLTYVRNLFVRQGELVPPAQMPPGVFAEPAVHQSDPLDPIIDVEDYRPSPLGTTAGLAAPGKYISSTDPVLDNADLAARGAFDASGDTFDDVLIYTTGRIELTGPLDGKVTLVSEYSGTGPAIEFRSGRFDLEPWSDDPFRLLAFTTAGTASACEQDDGMLFGGRDSANSSWEGLIYSPNGGIRMDCPDDDDDCSDTKNFDGSVVANTIDLNDSRYRFDEGPTGFGPRRARLFK